MTVSSLQETLTDSFRLSWRLSASADLVYWWRHSVEDNIKMDLKYIGFED
jgi:hypothetical protein